MAGAEEEDIDYGAPPWLHLLSAFLAMEPTDSLITLSRVCGGGSITESVQSFVWNHCIRKTDGKSYIPYLRTFLKKLILEIESTGGIVCDELYEQLSVYMTSVKGDDLANGNSRVLKQVSFIFPDEGPETPAHLRSRTVPITLQCSLNMLEGDTGNGQSSVRLLINRFYTNNPRTNGAALAKLCTHTFYVNVTVKVGSGVGLVGICLAHVKASQVILSDGDLSSLANLRLNLELNKLSLGTCLSEKNYQHLNMVQYLHLPWETAAEDDLQAFTPDVILGADVIYDPLCIPHLVRVLAALLRPKKTESPTNMTLTEGPVAYIASAVRNIDTFNYFFATAEEAKLSVRDITEKTKPFNLLPYMVSYQRANHPDNPLTRE